MSWALDLGTTNSGLARWDVAAAKPRLIKLPAVCRNPDSQEPLEAPVMIPSATHLIAAPDLWTRWGQTPWLQKRVFWGRQAWIGRQALERNEARRSPEYVPVFKPYLGREPLRVLARASGRSFTAREVAFTYLREVLAEARRQTGERIRDLVITTPVDAFEMYRAELSDIAKRLGVHRLRFIDEPVAAALGYGLGLGRERRMLVVDFGGGTLDVALVAIDARTLREGTCHVVAKAGRPIGGDVVDRWLLEAFAERAAIDIREDSHDWERGFWFQLALDEARRVKERLFFDEQVLFRLTPPESLRRFEAQLDGRAEPLTVTREDVVAVLEANGLYRTLEGCIDEVLQHAGGDPHIDDVLMVGGSTLLPHVYARVEGRFGRDRVRAFQPFEAVAYGACAYAADHFTQTDYIVHDYAFVTWDRARDQPQYTVVVPRGTRFPSGEALWRRQLVPTCSHGAPEHIFSLVICEIGRDVGDERRYAWNRAGHVKKLGGHGAEGGVQVVVPLNEANPTLGYLNPPHAPDDRRPRLDISFGVDENRWLVASVTDLRTQQRLLEGEPVVRLL